MAETPQEDRPVGRGENVTIGVAANLAPYFDAVLKRRDMPAAVTRLASGNLTYTFPAGIRRNQVVEMLEEAYTRQMADQPQGN